jgi:hypothetical protein
MNSKRSLKEIEAEIEALEILFAPPQVARIAILEPLPNGGYRDQLTGDEYAALDDITGVDVRVIMPPRLDDPA